MRKLSGWQKVGIFAGVGCFSIILIIVVGVAIAVSVARSRLAELGDPTPRRVERTITLPAPAAVPAEKPDARDAGAAAAAGAVKTAGDPQRLEIDLEEGSFDIRPGAAGSDVKVEGEFAEGLYELTQNTIDNAGGSKKTTVRFRSKAPAWARILGGMGGNNRGRRPSLTLTIPEGLPIDLSLRVAMGESRIDLGGLTLTELGLDLSMGNHEIDFKEPVEGLNRLRLQTQMGNVRVSNLGNAGAKTIDGSGSMGNLSADLGGNWKPGTEAQASFTQSMGELTINVPTKVKLDAEIHTSQGEAPPAPSTADEPTDPNAPKLKLRVSTSMGESRVRRY
jgi:hypothetical protein